MDDRKEWNEINIVDAEDILSIEASEINKWNHPYSPIPLTDEWMIRFGGNIMSGYSILRLSILIHDKETDLAFELMDGVLILYANDVRIYICKNPSVHQFQNLYFPITRKELKHQPIKK